MQYYSIFWLFWLKEVILIRPTLLKEKVHFYAFDFYQASEILYVMNCV